MIPFSFTLTASFLPWVSWYWWSLCSAWSKSRCEGLNPRPVLQFDIHIFDEQWTISIDRSFESDFDFLFSFRKLQSFNNWQYCSRVLRCVLCWNVQCWGFYLKSCIMLPLTYHVTRKLKLGMMSFLSSTHLRCRVGKKHRLLHVHFFLANKMAS